MRVRVALLIVVTAAVVASIACGSGSPSPTPVLLSLRAIIASTDLAQGENRFVFALLDRNSSPVRASGARVMLSYLQDGTPVHYGEVDAPFRRWPAGPGGVYTAQVDFPNAGTWLAEIVPEDGDVAGDVARLSFQVQEQSITPSLGSQAPRSQNRTASDAANLSEVSSDPEPDPDLYALSIAQALQTGRPLVVTFATPAFCESATCGPQVEVVKLLKEAYREQANFIHVEIYENPQEMREDLSKGRISVVVQEWWLPSEPWTFLMDAQGRVAAKFEAFTSYEELDEAIRRLLAR